MANITAAMVKELRDKTGAGMMDCKTALTESDGDLEAAVDWLRAKGLAKAAKKASRVASEGLVTVAGGGKAAAVAEVNSETDFVARNEQFQSMVRTIGEVALENGGDFEKTASADFPGVGKSVTDHVTEMVAQIGENMSLRRAAGISVENGVVATYVHGAVAPGVGRIGVIVGIESTGDDAALQAFGKQVAMHVAATAPLAVRVEDLDPAVVERERAILVEQARESGKPENIIDKMVEGRLRKFYEESVLLTQLFVVEPDFTIEAVVKRIEGEIGTSLTITGFERFVLGEGVEKEEADFAAEVAAAAAG